jgi:hypothetical protein
MPLHWDTRIEQAHVEDRVKRLGVVKTAVYVLGCLTHARDAVVSCHSHPLPDFHPIFQSMADMLDEFWLEYPRCLDSSSLSDTLHSVFDILPKEEQRMSEFVLAEDVWMDGMSFALGLFQTNDSEKIALDALNAIDRAYVFVYTFHHELYGMYQSEAEIRAVESTSKFCTDEIEFQIALLGVIESLKGMPPPYAKLNTLL